LDIGLYALRVAVAVERDLRRTLLHPPDGLFGLAKDRVRTNAPPDDVRLAGPPAWLLQQDDYVRGAPSASRKNV